jgi:hypothetical protein
LDCEGNPAVRAEFVAGVLLVGRRSTLQVLVFWEVAEGEEITLCRRLS